MALRKYKFADNVNLSDWIQANTYVSASGGLASASSSNPAPIDTAGQANPAPDIIYKSFLYVNSSANPINGVIPNLPASKSLVVRFYHWMNAGFLGGSLNIKPTIGGVVKPNFIVPTEKGTTNELSGATDSSGNLTFSLLGQSGGTSVVNNVFINGLVVVIPELKYSLSKTNPQKNELVNVTYSNSDLVSTSWTLNGSPIPQSQVDSGLYFGSEGTKTLQYSGVDSLGQTWTFSKSFYVGDLLGSPQVAKGTTAQYSTDIANPKYSIQGSSNIVSGTENYIDSTGKLYANKIETIGLRAENNFWTDTVRWQSQSDNSVKLLNNSDYFQVIADKVKLTEAGDEISFPITSKELYVTGYDNNSSFQYIVFQGLRETGFDDVGFLTNLNQICRIKRRSDGKVDILLDNVLKVTTQRTYGDLYFSVVNTTATPVGYIFPRPTYSGTGITGYKLATKSVAVYQQLAVDFNVVDAVEGDPVTAANQSTGGLGAVSYAWYLGAAVQPFSTDPSGVTLNLPVGNYALKLIGTDNTGSYPVTKTFAVTVVQPLVITTTSPLADGAVNVALNVQFASTGGKGAKTWAITKGALPAGVTFSAGGLLAGQTAAAGIYQFTATVTDGRGVKTSKDFVLYISAGGGAFAVDVSKQVYRAGSNYVDAETFPPVFKVRNAPASVNFSDGGAGGQFMALGGGFWRYTPANRSRYVVVTVNSDVQNITKTLQIYGTFPLQPQREFDHTLDRETKLRRARGGTRYFREDYENEIAVSMQFERRITQEMEALWNFWQAHRKVTPFYYWDAESGMLNKVRFETGISRRFIQACGWTLQCGLRGDFENVTESYDYS